MSEERQKEIPGNGCWWELLGPRDQGELTQQYARGQVELDDCGLLVQLSGVPAEGATDLHSKTKYAMVTLLQIQLEVDTDGLVLCVRDWRACRTNDDVHVVDEQPQVMIRLERPLDVPYPKEGRLEKTGAAGK